MAPVWHIELPCPWRSNAGSLASPLSLSLSVSLCLCLSLSLFLCALALLFFGACTPPLLFGEPFWHKKGGKREERRGVRRGERRGREVSASNPSRPMSDPKKVKINFRGPKSIIAIFGFGLSTPNPRPEGNEFGVGKIELGLTTEPKKLQKLTILDIFEVNYCSLGVPKSSFSIRATQAQFCRPQICCPGLGFEVGNPSTQKVQYLTSKVNFQKPTSSNPLPGQKPTLRAMSPPSNPSRPRIRKLTVKFRCRNISGIARHRATQPPDLGQNEPKQESHRGSRGSIAAPAQPALWRQSCYMGPIAAMLSPIAV